MAGKQVWKGRWSRQWILSRMRMDMVDNNSVVGPVMSGIVSAFTLER